MARGSKNCYTDDYVFKNKAEKLADEIAETKKRLNLQTDVLKKEMKASEFGDQANQRSKDQLQAKKQPEAEPKPSEKSGRFVSKEPIENDVFIDHKKPKSLEEQQIEQDEQDTKVANDLLDKKFNKLKKTRRQYR